MIPSLLESGENAFEKDFCGKPHKNDKIKGCTSKFVKMASIKKEFDIQCSGKTECNFNMISYMKNFDIETVEATRNTGKNECISD